MVVISNQICISKTVPKLATIRTVSKLNKPLSESALYRTFWGKYIYGSECTFKLFSEFRLSADQFLLNNLNI